MLEFLRQLALSLILTIILYEFIKKIYPREKKNYDMSDILKQNKADAIIASIIGGVILCLAIIIHILYKPFYGLYCGSCFLLFLGLAAIFPPKGRKIAEKCWVMRQDRDNFIVTLNDHKILICGELLMGKPGHVIYKESSPKWLPPHEKEPVLEKDYRFMLEAVLKFLEKQRRDGVIQGPGEHVIPHITKEEMILSYEKKGWKVERLPDGTTKVIPPPRKSFLSRIVDLFQNKRNPQ